MMVILFRSKLTAQAGADYQATDERMMARAAASPGFVDVKSYRADDGERLAVVRWRDAESLAALSASIAVNGVMAGCRPEYMPVLIAVVEAIVKPEFRLDTRAPGQERPAGSTAKPVRRAARTAER